jgi:predicted signal transduction protein with EAL and GGDEF domain
VVVAEGVEDIEQQNALNALGCDLGQGYLYSSPQPARCIDVLLDADRELASAPNLARALPVRLPRPRLAEQPWPLGRSIQI